MEQPTLVARRWYEAGYEVRRSGAGGHLQAGTVRLLLAATGRADAARMLAVHDGTATPGRGGVPVVRRQPLRAAPECSAHRLPAALIEVASRPWTLIEGCLVQDLPDADAIAWEWLEVTGSVAEAEAALNRLHLWDLLDDEDPEVDDVGAALALAQAWRRRLELLPEAGPIVIEIRDSADGPQLTVFRQDQTFA